MTLSPNTISGREETGQKRKIIELRDLISQRFPTAKALPMPARLATGVGVLDGSLEGGLPKGALTEIVCPTRSMGSGTIIQALVESSWAAGRHLALVDAANSFDPDGLSNADLTVLLWVQCTGIEQALKATDLLLRDGNIPLVMLDLMLCPEQQIRAVASTYWYRLQRVTEDHGSTVLAFTPTPVVGSAAATLRLTRHFGLPALDLLRDQFTAGLQMENVRARTLAPFGHHHRHEGLAVG